MGLKQPIRSWNLDDRKATAYHEAGHAVAQRYLRPHERIAKATIIRRGHALGFMMPAALEERTSLFARWIETDIMVSLAGHVVETKFLDALSTGPSSDLETATFWAEQYVGRFAMGPTKIIIPMTPGTPPIGPVIAGAHEMMDQLYEETDRLLQEKAAAVHHLARALIERLELIGPELEEVFAEVEATHPELKLPFERKILQFRDFAPLPDRSRDGWTPPVTSLADAEQPAASVGRPKGWEDPQTGTWLGSI